MLCLCFTTLMFVLSRTAAHIFVRIFTDNAEYTDLAIWGIRAFTLMIIPLSFQYVFVDGLTALGMTKTSLTLSLIRKSIYLGATCTLPLLSAAESAFYAEPLADGSSAVLSCIVFFCIYRKYLKGSGRLSEIRI